MPPGTGKGIGKGTQMGLYSKITPATTANPVRIVLGARECEVTSVREARAFFEAEEADDFADFLLADLGDDAGALVALRAKLDMMRAAL